MPYFTVVTVWYSDCSLTFETFKLQNNVVPVFVCFRWLFTLSSLLLAEGSAGPPVSINEARVRTKEKSKRRNWSGGEWRPCWVLHASSNHGQEARLSFCYPSFFSLPGGLVLLLLTLLPGSSFDNVNVDLPSEWGVQPHARIKGQQPCGWKRMWNINLVVLLVRIIHSVLRTEWPNLFLTLSCSHPLYVTNQIRLAAGKTATII